MNQQPFVLAPKKKSIGIARIEILSSIDFAGGQPVTEHLGYIFFRHLHADDTFTVNTVVRPELEVVTVPALVMHPGGAVAVFLPLGVVGTVITLEVFDACPELHRGVLGQVMGQSLPVKAQPEAVFPNQLPMTVDGFQMAPEVHGYHLSVIIPNYI